MEDHQCRHTVAYSKYEHNAPETRNWWKKLFNLLEGDAAIPPDKRIDVLNAIFPAKILDRILAILDVTDSKYAGGTAKERVKCRSVVTEHRESIESIVYSGEEEPNRTDVGPSNPYLEIFYRNPDRAAIWYPLPPLSRSEMNLNQKAVAIAEAIARDFVLWLKTIADENDAPSPLTFTTVKKMFEIGFDTHAAKSLCVNIKEMASVPDAVATLKEMPEMARRRQLHRQIRRDIDASKRKPKYFAFGTKLPRNMLVPPSDDKVARKFLTCERVPENLRTMSTVWEGITHLRSTRAFCEWLVKRPDIKPPIYLLENNMLDPNYLLKAQSSMRMMENR